MAMTKQACATRMEELKDAITAYAKLLVEDGAAIQSGQELVVQCPVEAYEFGRLVVEQAYAAGVGHVTMIWGDEPLARLDYLNCPVSYFETVPSWKREQLNSLAEKGAAFLFIAGSDPMALAGIDPAKPAAASRARNSQCSSFRDGMDFGRNVWCIAGVPVKAWATTVFSDVSEDEAMVKLWEAILAVSRSLTGIPTRIGKSITLVLIETLSFLIAISSIGCGIVLLTAPILRLVLPRSMFGKAALLLLSLEHASFPTFLPRKSLQHLTACVPTARFSRHYRW